MRGRERRRNKLGKVENSERWKEREKESGKKRERDREIK